MEALITPQTETIPLVCLICCKSYVDTSVLPDSEHVYANIVFDHTERPKMHVVRPDLPAPMDCRHVYVTEAEFLAGANDRLKDRIEESHRQAELARKRAAKGTRWFPLEAKDRMDAAFLAVDAQARWCMRNPPRMVTLKYAGTGRAKGGVRSDDSLEVFWLDTAKSYKVVAQHVKQFAALWELAFGFPLDAMRVLEFATKGFNPHFHLLMEIPVDSFGADVRSVVNSKSKYYALLHNRTVTDFIELGWAHVTGQKADISRPDGKGNVSWVPKAHEVPPADSILDYVERFIDYSRKGGKNADKITQHKVAWQWDDQQVNFWGLVGFRGLRRAVDAPLVLECRTPAAVTAARLYMARLVEDEAKLELKEKKDGSWVEVDVSYWKVGGDGRSGGRLKRKVTDAEETVLRRLVAYYNMSGIVAPETVPEPLEGPSSDAVPVYGESVDEPFRRNTRFIVAVRESAPSWWEREGAEEYLANMIADVEVD